MSEQSHYVIITTIEDVVRRAKAAMATIRERNGGEDPPTLGDGQAIAPAAWAELIWCLNTLAENGECARPDQDLLDRAGVRPIGEVMGG
jgi:hypothetical protein